MCCLLSFSSRKKDDKREKSLSPLSKRMALMDPTNDGEGIEYRGLVGYKICENDCRSVDFSVCQTKVFVMS